MDEAKRYQVILTKPAVLSYQRRILSYLNDYFSPKRALEIDQRILSQVKTLEVYPRRGRLEELLRDTSKEFRFILFRETPNLEIKIIYLINEVKETVYVTDLFPTKMSPTRIIED